MASPDILDFDRLLEPIPGENPAGEALREDFSPTAVYQTIKMARETARAAERNAWDDEGESSSSQAEWRPILQLVPDAIAEKSKDLEITAWLAEALVREHGFAGLRDAFRLARELAERFWDHLYPLPDEDGVMTRVAPITGLNGEDADGVLITPLANVPLTAPGTYRGLSLADYKQAADLEQVGDPDLRSQRIDQGAVSMQMFDKSVLETPPDFFVNLYADLEACREEFTKLGAVLEERCGQDESGYPLSPPTSNIRNALEACHDCLRSVAGGILDGPEEESTEESGETSDGPAGASTAKGKRTRDAAFRELLDVAEFFKRTEPHSPVSYALEQAVRWGKMPLPELLTELIPEEMTRDQLFKLVGIKPPQED